MHKNAHGGQNLNIQNIFDRACDDITLCYSSFVVFFYV